MIVFINGCTYHGISHHIECFYLSEDGRFWDDHHQLRFQREDELLDYLMKVEYDFHPVISEKTFEIMRHFGWYEGRHTNTTEFDKELKKYKIVLSQTQLDTISEFSGIEFSFSSHSFDNEFLSLEGIIELLAEDHSRFFNQRSMTVTIPTYLSAEMF